MVFVLKLNFIVSRKRSYFWCNCKNYMEFFLLTRDSFTRIEKVTPFSRWTIFCAIFFIRSCFMLVFSVNFWNISLLKTIGAHIVHNSNCSLFLIHFTTLSKWSNKKSLREISRLQAQVAQTLCTHLMHIWWKRFAATQSFSNSSPAYFTRKFTSFLRGGTIVCWKRFSRARLKDCIH